jgi:hypothetical protein
MDATGPNKTAVNTVDGEKDLVDIDVDATGGRRDGDGGCDRIDVDATGGRRGGDGGRDRIDTEGRRDGDGGRDQIDVDATGGRRGGDGGRDRIDVDATEGRCDGDGGCDRIDGDATGGRRDGDVGDVVCVHGSEALIDGSYATDVIHVGTRGYDSPLYNDSPLYDAIGKAVLSACATLHVCTEDDAMDLSVHVKFMVLMRSGSESYSLDESASLPNTSARRLVCVYMHRSTAALATLCAMSCVPLRNKSHIYLCAKTWIIPACTSGCLSIYRSGCQTIAVRSWLWFWRRSGSTCARGARFRRVI